MEITATLRPLVDDLAGLHPRSTMERSLRAAWLCWDAAKDNDIWYFSELCCRSAVEWVAQSGEDVWQWAMAPRLPSPAERHAYAGGLRINLRARESQHAVILETLEIVDAEIVASQYRMLTEWSLDTLREFVRETIASLWRIHATPA